MSGARYISQSRVDSSQKEAKYLAIVLLATSAWLLHCGWCDDIVKCEVRSRVKSFWDILAQNFVPWSVTRSSGVPKRQIHLSNIASTTVAASLFGKATNSTYLVKASVIQRINFFPLSEVLSGPNKSVCTICPGSVGRGSGDRSVGRGQSSRHLIWQR